ncbi:MAG: hypothetical protein IT431_12280 [Phycisphaerales bacterium]|nr:hypothetical protein [Phycisphaerales bacterium]
MSNEPDNTIEIECHRHGKSGKFAVILRLTDGDSLVRYILLADQTAREQYADEICELRPGIDRNDLLHALEQEAARQLSDHSGDRGGGSQADRIVAAVMGIEGLELFHTPEGKAYASIPVDDHTETWPINNKGFKEWVARLSYQQFGKVPGSQAVQDALTAIAGAARFDGAQHEVHLRVAGHGDDIWLDLCDADWRAVRITADGWLVVPGREVPVKFIRRDGMLPLPAPVKGGCIEALRPLMNMADDDTWTLAMGWLVAAFRPTGPYGVLSVSGEQGSAKSTVCKLLRGLIDPNAAPLRRMPKSERDVFISAGNSRLCAYNNMSGVRPELSDALCALATDGGFATRLLYADDEEAIFTARRPVILNGIEDPASRSDLVDRTISISLPRIPEDQRRTETEILAEYERLRPGVLGAILDAVASALKRQGEVSFPTLPRMADLTIWVTAAEAGIGWEHGRFHTAFMGNRAESHEDVVAASPIGPAVVAIVREGPFEGTATELLAALNSRRGEEPPAKDWPTNYSGMSAALKRLAPDLRATGMIVELPERGRGRQKRRVIYLELPGNQRSARAADDPDEDGGDGARRTGGGPVRPDAGPCGDADRAARAARPIRTQSNKGDDPWRQ